MMSGDHASSNTWNNMQQGGAMTTAVGDPGGGGGMPMGPGGDPMSPNGQYGQPGQPDQSAFPYPGGGPPGGGEEKPAAAEKKTIRRVGAKPPPDRAPRSIYCFSVKNPFRKRIIELGRDGQRLCV